MKHLNIVLISFFLGPVLVSSQTELTFDDYNDQDLVFNNFSGNTGEWQGSGAQISKDCETENPYGEDGACLKLRYSFPTEMGGCGYWLSTISQVDSLYMSLDFLDIYGDLKNSDNNSSNVEDVEITAFQFMARGTGIGDLNHIINVEFKDVNGATGLKVIDVSNAEDWALYNIPMSEIEGVDLNHVKQIVFTLWGNRNEFRTDSFYLDQLTFITNEPSYDATLWPDDEFLDLVSHRAFKYFLDFTDTLGFTFDRSTFSDLVSVGAIGFQLTAYCIGEERGWADGLEAKIENILRNLVNLPMGDGVSGYAGYKGFFYHFLNANTGLRKDENVELSTYDTMLLMYGVLTCKEKYPDNSNIQMYADALYNAIEWSWMVDPANNQFHLGWMPETNEFLGHIDGYTDEALLVDVLALGSNTFPITMDTYNARTRVFGENIGVYPDNSSDTTVVAWSGSLFNYFFADCWLNLKHCGQDNHSDYPVDIWENNRRAIQANYQFCIDHQDDIPGDGDEKYTTYSNQAWGITASDNLVPKDSGLLSQYFAFGGLPTQQNIQFENVNPAPHLGTIAVYGAGSSINFLPNEVITTLRNYYENIGIWTPIFGFGDAFSTDPHYFEIDPNTFTPILDSLDNLIIHPADWMNGDWINSVLLGVDQGPMLLAIENYQHGSVWGLTMQNESIRAGLDSIFDLSSCLVNSVTIPEEEFSFDISPNPNRGSFNVSVDRLSESTNLIVYDIQGKVVYQKDFSKFEFSDAVEVVIPNAIPGTYLVQLLSGRNIGVKKIIIY